MYIFSSPLHNEYSLITKIYIAPLPGYYSGALPTPVQLGEHKMSQNGP